MRIPVVMRSDRSMRTLLGLWCWALAVLCTGQPTLLFDRLGTPQGLPGTEIYALLEDRAGRIWVGTEAGLARMEGTRVRVWQHDPRDSTSLSNQLVSALAEDDLGQIWVATAHGFQRHLPHHDRFERFHVPRSGPQRGSDRIYSLTPDGRNGLWLVTDEGLWRFDTQGRTFTRIRASEQVSLSWTRRLVSGTVRDTTPRVGAASRLGMWPGPRWTAVAASGGSMPTASSWCIGPRPMVRWFV